MKHPQALQQKSQLQSRNITQVCQSNQQQSFWRTNSHLYRWFCKPRPLRSSRTLFHSNIRMESLQLLLNPAGWTLCNWQGSHIHTLHRPHWNQHLYRFQQTPGWQFNINYHPTFENYVTSKSYPTIRQKIHLETKILQHLAWVSRGWPLQIIIGQTSQVMCQETRPL